MVQATEEIEQRVELKERKLPESLKSLDRLAWNYWWSWTGGGTSVFRDLDPTVWEECEHNPRRLLTEVSEFRLTQMATDPVYCERVRQLAKRFEQYMADERTWESRSEKKKITRENPVAYFCAEYGIHNSLPLYSGGLGILAGDHLKSASDLRLPLVAVGLLYHYGYFRQRLRRDGWQEELYGETYPAVLPIHQVKDEAGAPVIIEVLMRGRTVRAQAWRVDVGRIPLYLLDTNIEENEETDRLVTGHLYGGDRETRVVQEMLLGIGGVRLLRRLGIEPQVFHLNEGHSAFLTLELAREVREAEGLSFHEAAPRVRERCVFTTHTPIAAGNDEFIVPLIEKCFDQSYEESLGISHEDFINLGRITANEEELYGLTPLAIKMCRSTNGVSRKHGEVSRALWQKLWPERTVDEIPITSVTNGVHAPTWVAPMIRALYEKHVGGNWSEMTGDPEEWRRRIAAISDEELWLAHSLLKQRLIAFVHHRTFQKRLGNNESTDYTESARTMFDPRALTIGFARRVAAYKRWELILTDPQRILRLMASAERPVQFIFAGKAHPQDQGAKLVLQHMSQWKHDPFVRSRAVFLQDYDQEIARQLVQSVDVWMNVPRRPLEASGTSGEKVAMNGGLNLSILDGWWIEGYDGTNGFAVGDAAPGEENSDIDEADAESLYRTLEEEVVPAYYERDSQDIPRRWVEMMRRSIETLVPAFNSDRMVEEYAQRIYLERPNK